MDLGAYAIGSAPNVSEYLSQHFLDIPRFRGARFMKVEVAQGEKGSDQMDIFNRYCGQDVIYIHTRCGHGGYGWKDPESNYIACGAEDWEASLKDSFLEHCVDEFDPTYCDHYFKADPSDAQYLAILEFFTRHVEQKDGEVSDGKD